MLHTELLSLLIFVTLMCIKNLTSSVERCDIIAILSFHRLKTILFFVFVVNSMLKDFFQFLNLKFIQ